MSRAFYTTCRSEPKPQATMSKEGRSVKQVERTGFALSFHVVAPFQLVEASAGAFGVRVQKVCSNQEREWARHDIQVAIEAIERALESERNGDAS
jgi:hypothetical protein